MGSILTREFQVRWRLTEREWIGVILGLGVVARVGQYLAGRSLWLDEGYLASNIVGHPIFSWPGPSAYPQVYPPGFIVVERALVQLLGGSTYALRLFPLLCGVGALFLFLAVVRAVLEPRAVPVALALFAASDDLIYFGAELKQYSTDVLAALAACGIAILARRGALTPGRVAGFGVMGAGLVWFSHPSVFVLAGVGLVLLGMALRARRWREAAAWSVMGLAWASSFAGSYLVSKAMAGEQPWMWVFWAFAFPTIPPTSIEEALWAPRAVLNLFVNPLSFPSPLGRRPLGLVAFALFLVGCVSLGRRRPDWLAMLLAPIGLALLASAPKLYPFHGRLVLFLVPMLLLVVAEGVGAIGARFGRGTLYGLAIAALLLFPTLLAAWHLAEPRQRSFFNPVGDYRESDERF